ncbi:hypothetical protein AFL01nite_22590 [Aeromicrobium flavum]|uniref:Small secreted hydrophilic protein n=1 Tax=Aeromicrobium flavum TaxID=416568 RepID=A0A512HWV5_9ACTN|nr:hypothetical protein [Aeromicrobium flavum]GEO89932.1 hypothetical protein AFL01nite_22590 [Aeromicrobium flavum]
MRPRPLLTIAVVAALVLVLGGLLVDRLLPADGSDGTVEPVVISPAGLTRSGGPTATAPPASPAATPPTTPPTARPTTPAPTQPTQVKPRPRPVDEDDDDHEEDDDRRVGEDDDGPDDD